MRPDFVIVGAQKGGSTALAQFLGRHPQVFLPPGETRYFRDPWFHFEAPVTLDAAVAAAGPAVRRRGIKSPDLLAQASAPDRIRAALGPDVALLAVLRHPVDRAVSSYFWMQQYGLLPAAGVEQGMRHVLDGDWDEYPHATHVLDYGRYATHLQRYEQTFGPGRMLTLLDTDLRRDTLATLADVCRFLDVEPDALPAQLAGRSVNEGVYSPVRLKVLSLRHDAVRRQYPGFPGDYLEAPNTPSGRVRSAAVAAVDRLLLRRVVPNERPELSPELRARLLAAYREDNERLEQVLGRDLSAWSR